jgi:hypothetical protein
MTNDQQRELIQRAYAANHDLMAIASAFNNLPRDVSGGWMRGEIIYHVTADGNIDLIDEIKMSNLGDDNDCSATTSQAAQMRGHSA